LEFAQNARDHNIPPLHFLIQKEINGLAEKRPAFRRLASRQNQAGIGNARSLQGLCQSVQMQWGDVAIGDDRHFRPL
jgi:hypothetical protein